MKRGQGNLFSILIIIVIAIAAFIVLFNSVKPLVNEKSGGIEIGLRDYIQMLFESNESVCGDGTCNLGESCLDCPSDCQPNETINCSGQIIQVCSAVNSCCSPQDCNGNRCDENNQCTLIDPCKEHCSGYLGTVQVSGSCRGPYLENGRYQFDGKSEVWDAVYIKKNILTKNGYLAVSPSVVNYKNYCYATGDLAGQYNYDYRVFLFAGSRFCTSESCNGINIPENSFCQGSSPGYAYIPGKGFNGPIGVNFRIKDSYINLYSSCTLAKKQLDCESCGFAGFGCNRSSCRGMGDCFYDPHFWPWEPDCYGVDLINVERSIVNTQGSDYEVRLEIKVNESAGIKAFAIKESYPAKWQILGASDGGVYNTSSRLNESKIEWLASEFTEIAAGDATLSYSARKTNSNNLFDGKWETINKTGVTGGDTRI